MTCTVCCDPYTKEVRKPVACLACGYEACLRCVKTFLLTTPEPNCMNCHAGWNREFLDQHLTRSWREGPLKERRAAFLFDRERSMLPATQGAVEAELQRRAYAEELKVTYAQMDELREERDTVEEEYCTLKNQESDDTEKLADLRVRQTAILKRIDEYRDYCMILGQYIRFGSGSEPKEKRQFVAACPSDCRGFLSTAYKCGTCQKQFCASCREPKTEGHTCDPDLVATIAAIVKDSRPCPACGMAISKVSGCDQMYCTSCDTAFSYETGAVVTGVIHNPHYFERMRTLHGSVPRQPGECGMPAFRSLSLEIRNNLQACQFYRSVLHVEDVTLRRDLPTTTDNTDLRVKYLLKELDEDKFRQAIQQRDRVRSRNLEFRGPLELYVITVMEFFLQDPTPAKLPALLDQITKLVNEPLQVIGQRYNNRYPQIDTEGNVEFKTVKA